MTSSPPFFNAATAEGISATRFSPGHVSRGTPTFMPRSLFDFLDPIRDRRRNGGIDGGLPALRQGLRDLREDRHLRGRRLLAGARRLRQLLGLARRHRRIEIAV